ncbi:NUDIX hydrolase [Pseudobacillus wudalianchiensis]|uniref:NUDIX hydrolase n=1 Tax=Pseudobacillus wudalianchiensis TaxID=1743143 RepID=A0A1B9AZ26_9BACI|nr:NUDIX domain-containing protein [Bacillus wudalianchiensis]OCA89060.1 NUDIX hydrolase [Bacillus wudalianchiensis]
MTIEMIKVIDEKRNEIGIASRNEVHKKGYWHETFHCWVISKKENGYNLHLQVRSETKKDFPSLLDITAAGHLLAHETVQDGVREVQEELGLDVAFNDLILLGIIPDRLHIADFLDNEWCHVFLYESMRPIEGYSLQREEVAGIVAVDLSAFLKLCEGEERTILGEGFLMNQDNEQIPFKRMISKADFVPHEEAYFKNVASSIHKYIGQWQ